MHSKEHIVIVGGRRMKLQIVEYNQGKRIGCSQDTVWFIQEKEHTGDKWKMVYWDNDYKMPGESECYFSCCAYYTLALAENAFNKIIEYKTKYEPKVIKEVEIDI